MQNTTASKTIILFSSWLVISAIGAVLLHHYWSSVPIYSKTRPLVFIAVMGCVHFVAYCIYTNQHFGFRWFSILLAPEYKPALKASVIQQFLAFVLSALTLDFGILNHCCLIAFWFIGSLLR